MIVAAALCPAPPLLAGALSGADPQAARLRSACGAAVAALLAAGPDLIAVAGAAPSTGVLAERARPDLTVYGGPSTLDRPAVVAPPVVGMGALLLDEAGWTGRSLLQTVGADADHAAVARSLAGAAGRVALLVMADGSARRNMKVPGPLDEQAAAFDAEVERAVTAGDPAALQHMDPKRAEEQMTDAWPAWQVLAAAFDGRPVTGTVRYSDAPYEVGYLVATLEPAVPA